MPKGAINKATQSQEQSESNFGPNPESINASLWQVPADEFAYFAAASQNAQIRVDHGDRVEDVKDAIIILHSRQASAEGRMVILFEGEVCGDDEFLAKIEREYVDSVSQESSAKPIAAHAANAPEMTP